MELIDPSVSERILSSLKKQEGVPIKKIAADIHVSVQTTSKYCFILAAQNKVKIECYGNMKLVSKK